MSKFKEFENKFKAAVEKVDGVSIDRIPDQVSRFKGSNNIADFVAYKYPHQYYFECKTIEGGTLPFTNITQWQDLLEKSRVPGIIAGVVVWFYERTEIATIFVDIRLLECMKQEGYKSFPWDCHFVTDTNVEGWSDYWLPIQGEKKRVYYEYDMEEFFKELETLYRRN